MMLGPRFLLPVLLAFFALAACQQSTTTVPKPVLPGLDRPLFKIKFKSNDRIMVPVINIINRGGVTGVFVLQDNLARFRMIRTGKQSVNHVEVLSGLSGSETLVGGELSSVHDGSPINITK